MSINPIHSKETRPDKTQGMRAPTGARCAHLEMGQEWMDLRCLTRYASVSDRTLREWLHRALDPLPAVRVGNKILVRRSRFDEWLEAHPLTPANAVDVEGIVSEILRDVGAED